jgi:release factor glutamine methyltransferase
MGPETWTIGRLLDVTATFLKKKGIESPRLCADILLSHTLHRDRVNLYLHYDQPLTEGEIARFRSLIKRRLKREPVQYITGIQEFWSMDFMVGPQVLIPRPESEVLMEQVLSLCGEKRMPNPDRPMILDLCTGSGALVIALAREIQGASLWASDMSMDALELARKNSIKHGVESRIEFLQGDLLDPFLKQGMKFDAILSNPPYIPSGSLDALCPEVRDYEPMQALDGGEDGMIYIERIIADGPDCLNHRGWLLIEMDPEQLPLASTQVDHSGRYGERRYVKDYSHRDRILMARKAEHRHENISG